MQYAFDDNKTNATVASSTIRHEDTASKQTLSHFKKHEDISQWWHPFNHFGHKKRPFDTLVPMTSTTQYITGAKKNMDKPHHRRRKQKSTDNVGRKSSNLLKWPPQPLAEKR
jgi:hypothetical protein